VIHDVVLSARARKQLRLVPAFIATKLAAWVEAVEEGLETVRKVPGFHDESLKGARSAGVSKSSQPFTRRSASLFGSA